MQVCTSEPAQNKKNVKITHAGFDCYNHLQPPWLEFFIDERLRWTAVGIV